MDNVSELLRNVESILENPNIDQKKVLSYYDDKLDYEIFLSEEALQVIKGPCSLAAKQWVVSFVSTHIIKSQTRNAINFLGCLTLYMTLLKTSLNNLPASTNLAKEILVGLTLTLNFCMNFIFRVDFKLWNNYNLLIQMIIKLVESQSDTLRIHAIKFIEQVILCFSFPDPTPRGTLPIATGEFTLAQIPSTFSYVQFEQMGNQFLEQMIKSLKKIAEKTNSEPLHAHFSVQIVLLNSLYRLFRKRTQKFTAIVLTTFFEVVKIANASYSAPTSARSLFISLRHILISIMKANKWDKYGLEILDALTLLDAKEIAEHLYKKLRLVEFREITRKRSLPPAVLPSSKRPKPSPYFFLF